MFAGQAEYTGDNANHMHEEITKQIIGCAMQVHRTLGNGFQEVIYQRALEIEMQLAGLRTEREKEMEILYRDQSIGKRRVDFFVENCIMVELKAIANLELIHLTQAKNYLEAYNMQIGLLINFGFTSLQFKRVYNNSLFQIRSYGEQSRQSFNPENQGSDRKKGTNI
jgi:GxxExxY protein